MQTVVPVVQAAPVDRSVQRVSVSCRAKQGLLNVPVAASIFEQTGPIVVNVVTLVPAVRCVRMVPANCPARQAYRTAVVAASM